jgi:two-component system, OmpR family, sensor histidine kinase KdpD
MRAFPQSSIAPAEPVAGGSGSSVSKLLRRRPRSRALGWGIALGGTALLTTGLLPIRGDLTPLSKGFFYLVIVVAAAATGGLAPGISASFLGFLVFNFFFLPPYGTFIIARGEYVVVLFVFLGISVLISLVVARASERAEAAEGREVELRLLQDLSSTLVELPPGIDAYRALLAQMLDRFAFGSAALFVQDEGEVRGLREEVTVGAESGSIEVRSDPTAPGRPQERLPLSIASRVVGLVVLCGDRAPLTPAESRVLRSVCDQLALVIERDRLLRTATRAEVYRQGDEMRRALLVAVSHDLRTPLAAIKTSVTDLLDEDVQHADEDRREALQAIDRESDRLNDLIANLLDMSRIELGVLKPRTASVSVGESVDSALDAVRSRWPVVDIRSQVDDVVVRADPVFLERVVGNLLENAARAASSSANPVVEVLGDRAGDRQIVRVRDHGLGVDDRSKQGLFYPFYRLDGRSVRLGPGLGLAIAKGFLSLMDGEIWVEETSGGGATFAFSLPAAQGSA